MKILKGDQVKVLIGKDKGRTGEVVKTFPKTTRVTVKGLNIFKKHIKATKDQKGGIIEKERSLMISKVALVCPNCQKVTRVGYQVDASGDKARICKKCGQVVTSKLKSSK